MASRLKKEDWILAGIKALSASGYGSLRAESIARTLNTTKGSFYWHFKDIEDYKQQVLQTWRVTRTEFIINEVKEFESGRDRLIALLGLATQADNHPFYAGAELSIREWARYDESAAAVVADVDRTRLDFLITQFTEMGISNEHYAKSLYAAYIGTRVLESTLGTSAEEDLSLVLNAFLNEK